jgi:hypothetical protein
MSFNNLLYDKDTSLQNIELSHDILKYRFNVPEQCTECYHPDPHNRIQRSGVSIDAKNEMIDVDSELLGITRKASKVIDEQYNPSRDNQKFNTLSHFNNCSHVENVEHTRLSNPPSTLRGTGWNRWEDLFINPQQLRHIELPFCNNVDTAILEKDSHRPFLHNKNNKNNKKYPVQPHQSADCPEVKSYPY